MQFAQRVQKLPPYLFAEVSKTIARKKSEGVDVISLGIGDPDIPTPPHVIDALCEAAQKPANHRYPETEGLPELRQAIAAWYERRFDVSLDPEKEICSLIGSKEGIGHLPLCLIDPGDVALIPDPAYPVYAIGTLFAGGEAHYLPLRAENRFLPDLAAIPSDVARQAKVLWLNYPNNPTGAVADLRFFDEVVNFAKQFDLVVCHDFAYSDVVFDDYIPPSFLQARGAKDVGVEFYSLSKSYNMTGWRIGAVVGNQDVVNALYRVKSNLDSGVPQAIQEMAIAALSGPETPIQENNRIYQRRRDLVVRTLRELGLELEPSKASLYLWARIPERFTSIQYATEVLDKTGVFLTPGIGYGEAGEGYVRISLTVPDARLDEAMARISKWAKERAATSA